MDFYYEDDVKNIQYRRCFLKADTAITGFQRFYSADPRFPISISAPRWASPFYDFNRPEYLHVDFSSSSDIAFRVSLENLAATASKGYDRAAAGVVMREEDLFGLMKDEFDRRKRNPAGLYDVGSYEITNRESEYLAVGERGYRAPRVIWYTRAKKLGGEWVFFQSRQQSGLWTITWDAKSGYDVNVFRQVLSSFRWLDGEFFRSIGVM